MRLAVVAAFLALTPSVAVADSPPVGHDTVLPVTFYLEIEGDGVKEATFVQPRADGMVVLTAPDGTVEYVPTYRVRRVADRDGVDLTSRLRRREWLGTPPPKLGKEKARTIWKSFRLRAGPKSACGSYLITDFSMMRTEGDRLGGLVCWVTDWGYARNIAAHHSIGATGFFGALGGDRTQAGMRLRLVRWFGPYVSLDVSPGVLLVDHEKGYPKLRRPGFSSQVGLNVGGRIGIVGQVFSATRSEPLGWLGLYPASTREVRETTWHLGIKLGAEPGIVGSASFLIAEGITQMETPTFKPTP